MSPARVTDPVLYRFTAVAEALGDDMWHVTVRELPDVWTVAFSRGAIEERARARIMMDHRLGAHQFDVKVELPPLYVERRTHRRNGSGHVP